MVTSPWTSLVGGSTLGRACLWHYGPLPARPLVDVRLLRMPTLSGRCPPSGGCPPLAVACPWRQMPTLWWMPASCDCLTPGRRPPSGGCPFPADACPFAVARPLREPASCGCRPSGWLASLFSFSTLLVMGFPPSRMRAHTYLVWASPPVSTGQAGQVGLSACLALSFPN